MYLKDYLEIFTNDVSDGRIQWMGEAKTGIKPMVEIKRRGEPYVRPRTKTSIEPMV